MFVLINEDIKISIIIPIYNCLEYLKNCIASVKKQTISPKEVICIDDGSTDGSYEYLKDLSKNDLEILVIQQENQGAGIARNKGLKKVENVSFRLFLYKTSKQVVSFPYSFVRSKVPYT